MFDRLRSGSQTGSDPETASQQPTGESGRLFDLSWELRVYCFGGCFILSLLCSFLGSPFIVTGKLTEFAVMVSLGAILSIGGTFFLSGPLNQLKKMVEPNRLVATIVYMTMIIMTLITGLVFKSPILAIICIVGQYLSMAWYSLSYIPYAREVLWSLIGRCC